MNTRLRVVIAGLVIGVVVGLVANRFVHPVEAKPVSSPGGAIECIAAAEPEWHFYPAGQSGIAAGFYVTTSPREDDIRGLPRSGDKLGLWSGVVLVTPSGYHRGISSESGHETRAGSFVIFGDPELAERVAIVLR